MNIIFVQNLDHSPYSNDIWNLLVNYDLSFIPPLSARENPYQSDLALNGDNAQTTKPYKYFENLKEQLFYIAVDEQNKAIGFMSFRMHYVCADLEDGIDTLYISTIIVDEQHRGKGITNSFYDEIEELAASEQRSVTTRTWSTNNSHIHVLKKRGYTNVHIIENGRGPQIDTVYFRKMI